VLFQVLVIFGVTYSTSVRYIPEWLPWFSYKRLARYGFDLGQKVVHGPMKFVGESIVRECPGNRACSKVQFSLGQRYGSAVAGS